MALVTLIAVPCGEVNVTLSAAAELLAIAVCSLIDCRKQPGVVTARVELALPGWGTGVAVEFVTDVGCPAVVAAQVEMDSDHPLRLLVLESLR